MLVPHPVAGLDFAHGTHNPARHRAGFGFSSHRAAKFQNRLDRCCDFARIGSEDCDPLLAQALDILAPVLLGIGDHQVRRKFNYRSNVGIFRAADLRARRHRRCRLDAKARHSDDLAIEPQGEKRFRPARHQRNDTPRPAFKFYFKSKIVCGLHPRLHYNALK